MVTGLPRAILRLEGAAVFVATIVLYQHAHGSWLVYSVLWLVPDISAAGYLFRKRIGAAAYDAAHFYGFPIALALAGVVADRTLLYKLALIWFSHIGVDRALGFGLKYSSAFNDTHLGTMGRPHKAS